MEQFWIGAIYMYFVLNLIIALLSVKSIIKFLSKAYKTDLYFYDRSQIILGNILVFVCTVAITMVAGVLLAMKEFLNLREE